MVCERIKQQILTSTESGALRLVLDERENLLDVAVKRVQKAIGVGGRKLHIFVQRLFHQSNIHPSKIIQHQHLMLVIKRTSPIPATCASFERSGQLNNKHRR